MKPEPRPSHMYDDRPSRASLFWLRQKGLLRRVGILLFVIILLGGGGWLSFSMVSDSTMTGIRTRLAAMDPLQIKHIIIRGRQLTEEDEIRAQLGTNENNNIFGFSVEQARQRIDALPFVEHSTVERHLPDTIVVTLVERVPIAIWQTQGHFILINDKGDPVSEQTVTAQDKEVFRKLPLVVGQGANTEAAATLDLLAHYPDIRNRTVALVRIGQRRWNLLLNNGTIILLPEGAEQASFKRLSDYQTQMHLLERPLKSIDMRLSDRMVIHPLTIESDPSPPPPAQPGSP
ncbi:FtsQ-type POTRA domain-containing protein [Saccharibacter sp. 17.LH.SD]|uniref:cell division protein FtsQ/DivIB n=1 Tax=Saccharibacter sp. 17.LH.SD TaxID=2689393 RepID=UPI00136AE277|nr:FtsQ-type POTRA domain-containing protein [Saccharibacter sp. 17.LH.SD]MXV44675.1 FtsQ-type POTRA domain-containing protein [Saccharibacter sp. 17.LH.SD]